MRKVPPEIDALMWQLAEEGGPVAQAEFEERYARYAPELSRRIKMVAGLREAGKTVAPRPRFVPRPTRTLAAPTWAIVSVSTLAVMSLGVLAYALVSFGSPTDVQKPTPQVVQNEPKTSVPATQVPIEKPVQVPPPVTSNTSPALPEAPKEAVYLKPRDVKIAETELSSAIALVAAGGGLRVTLAPGFPSKTVSLDYHGLNTIDTLKAMGDEYGFSVLEQEEGHYLAVPVRPGTDDPHRAGP